MITASISSIEKNLAGMPVVSIASLNVSELLRDD